MLRRVSDFRRNSAQPGDALVLLQSLPDCCTPLVFFDPQHRSVSTNLKFGNEGAPQRGRTTLPAMTEEYIDDVCFESARILKPGGYLMRGSTRTVYAKPTISASPSRLSPST
jgi:hypothetical protein